MQLISAHESPQNCDVIAIEEMSSPHILVMIDITTCIGVHVHEAK
jgi:hypothetical protein